jgi:hypothetical protein
MFSEQFIEMFYITNLLQLNLKMKAASVFVFLIIVTAHTSFARILSQQQFLRELRDYGVPEHDLPTCEFNS